MADVFLSYRNLPNRRALVERLAAILEAYGLEVWWDAGLEAGDPYRQQILGELASTKVVAPLWCAESVQSKWVHMEAELGKDKLIPARIQKVVVPNAFEAIQAADLINWNGSLDHGGLTHFVTKIAHRAGVPVKERTSLFNQLRSLPPLPLLPESKSEQPAEQTEQKPLGQNISLSLADKQLPILSDEVLKLGEEGFRLLNKAVDEMNSQEKQSVYSRGEAILRRAAELGHYRAMDRLADLLWYGEGLEKDRYEAFSYYYDSAQLGYTPAMFSLGLHLRKGCDEIAKRPEEAREWFRRDGGSLAQFHLANMYLNGEGGAPDRAAAVELLRNLARGNSSERREARQLLTKIGEWW